MRATTLTFDDVTAAGSCAGNYTVTRTWTVTDACANTATASQIITVRDITPPTIGAAGANATIDCPATPNFTAPTVSDACGATTLTFADVTAAGHVPGNYTLTRTWTVTDACANTATASQVITVRDITPPTFVLQVPMQQLIALLLLTLLHLQ
jgi:ribosomal protein S26